MKKNCAKVLAVALTLAMLPVMTYGASGSPQNSDEDSSSSSTVVEQEWHGGEGSSSAQVTLPDAPSVVVSATGEIVSVGQSSKDTSGVTMSVVVNSVTSDGKTVTMERGGIALVGNTAVKILTNAEETAGLPADVVNTINSLNNGADVNAVFAGQNVAGYQKLGNTRALELTTRYEGPAASESAGTEITMVINEMRRETTSLIVMYYDNATGRWVRADAAYNVAAKTVTFTVPGSCTVQFLWK